MHAVLVQVTISDRDQATNFLRGEIVPRVKQAPGFVAGYWVQFGENKGRSVIVFESEDAARGAAGQIEQEPGDFVSVDSVDVGEVVESA